LISIYVFSFSIARQSLLGQGLVIVEASRSHSVTRNTRQDSYGRGDQPNAETSTWQQRKLTRQRYIAPVGLEPAIPASERQQTHAIDRRATGTDFSLSCDQTFFVIQTYFELNAN